MQTKYFTLYSAYIYRLKRVLNKNGKNKYEFILCTGMSAMTEVAEFHEMEDDEYRLFKVEIAETSMYNIKDMLCILGHEVNSIYNYIRQKKDKNIYVALIFSEDGGVDIIDNFDVRKK